MNHHPWEASYCSRNGCLRGLVNYLRLNTFSLDCAGSHPKTIRLILEKFSLFGQILSFNCLTIKSHELDSGLWLNSRFLLAERGRSVGYIDDHSPWFSCEPCSWWCGRLAVRVQAMKPRHSPGREKLLSRWQEDQALRQIHIYKRMFSFRNFLLESIPAKAFQIQETFTWPPKGLSFGNWGVYNFSLSTDLWMELWKIKRFFYNFQNLSRFSSTRNINLIGFKSQSYDRNGIWCFSSYLFNFIDSWSHLWRLEKFSIPAWTISKVFSRSF